MKIFYKDIRQQIQDKIVEYSTDPEKNFPFPETVFTEIVMEHLKEENICLDDTTELYFERQIKNSRVKINGYAYSDDELERIDFFVTNYEDTDEIKNITDTEIKDCIKKCFRFIQFSSNGKLQQSVEESSRENEFATLFLDNIENIYKITIFVLTNRISKFPSHSSLSLDEKNIHLKNKEITVEIVDIERLYNHFVSGRARDEISIDLKKYGIVLPCIYFPGKEPQTDYDCGYDYALTAFPGELLRSLYAKYDARLMEANVRSYLTAKRKVNKGIFNTIEKEPERFMAYNNGLVMIVDDMTVEEIVEDGKFKGVGISWMKGLQIVNGGQTTASLYFCVQNAKKSHKICDVSKVRIPVKIIHIHNNIQNMSDNEEDFILNIATYANTQNKIEISDLSSNRKIHRRIEELVNTDVCPDGKSKWFYERANGGYNTYINKKSTTPSIGKKLKTIMPVSRKITKTDLAKYLNIWKIKPYDVAKGSQKNFAIFIKTIDHIQKNNKLSGDYAFGIDLTWTRKMISIAILFKEIDKLVRTLKTESKINVTTYTVSLFVLKYKDRFDLMKVWKEQKISDQLSKMLLDWASIVYQRMHNFSNGKLLSEAAKKAECWEVVKNGDYPTDMVQYIPEICAAPLADDHFPFPYKAKLS